MIFQIDLSDSMKYNKSLTIAIKRLNCPGYAYVEDNLGYEERRLISGGSEFQRKDGAEIRTPPLITFDP